MLYYVGNILECKETIAAKELEMSNPEFDIMPGNKFKVTDRDNYPRTNPSHWYELTSLTDGRIVLNAWNDEPDHKILDDKFILVYD